MNKKRPQTGFNCNLLMPFTSTIDKWAILRYHLGMSLLIFLLVVAGVGAAYYLYSFARIVYAILYILLAGGTSLYDPRHTRKLLKFRANLSSAQFP